jgi:arabinose-5-phosphate isomerase
MLLSKALLEMSAKGLAMTAVIDANDTLLGVFTDGDLRRKLDSGIDIHTTRIGDVMNANSKTVTGDMLAAEALNIMDDFKIVALLVVDEHRHPIGALHLRDLTRAGLA